MLPTVSNKPTNSLVGSHQQRIVIEWQECIERFILVTSLSAFVVKYLVVCIDSTHAWADSTHAWADGQRIRLLAAAEAESKSRSRIRILRLEPIWLFRSVLVQN